MNAFTKVFVITTAAAALAFAWGCSDDHDHGDGNHSHADAGGAHTSPYPACNEITAACHEVDVEEGPIHTCHDEAHAAKSNDDCVPKKDNCLAICKAAAADAGHDGH
jgi:hypothetical protein